MTHFLAARITQTCNFTHVKNNRARRAGMINGETIRASSKRTVIDSANRVHAHFYIISWEMLLFFSADSRWRDIKEKEREEDDVSFIDSLKIRSRLKCIIRHSAHIVYSRILIYYKSLIDYLARERMNIKLIY